jgi:hypothetical protein
MLAADGAVGYGPSEADDRPHAPSLDPQGREPGLTGLGDGLGPGR